MAIVDGKYKMNIVIDYEIKANRTELELIVPKKELQKRLKQIKRLAKYLNKLRVAGWDISTIEVATNE